MAPRTSLPKPAQKLRAADIAYDLIESMIVTLQLQPGAPVVEAELVEATGLGRTPLREALMRMSSSGLIVQLPRRGLIVSDIEPGEHLNLLETRRVLERLIAALAARRASPAQRKQILAYTQKMVSAAARNDLRAYMDADQGLDHVVHEACRNRSAVAAVVPLIVKCRRFWYAYQHEGDIVEAARAHMQMAEAIEQGDAQSASGGADGLMDYLDAFARKVISA